MEYCIPVRNKNEYEAADPMGFLRVRPEEFEAMLILVMSEAKAELIEYFSCACSLPNKTELKKYTEREERLYSRRTPSDLIASMWR